MRYFINKISFGQSVHHVMCVRYAGKAYSQSESSGITIQDLDNITSSYAISPFFIEQVAGFLQWAQVLQSRPSEKKAALGKISMLAAVRQFNRSSSTPKTSKTAVAASSWPGDRPLTEPRYCTSSLTNVRLIYFDRKLDYQRPGNAPGPPVLPGKHGVRARSPCQARRTSYTYPWLQGPCPPRDTLHHIVRISPVGLSALSVLDVLLPEFDKSLCPMIHQDSWVRWAKKKARFING